MPLVTILILEKYELILFAALGWFHWVAGFFFEEGKTPSWLTVFGRCFVLHRDFLVTED